jgi:23S rRNA pseudouridine1911/1915/1917 synthase
MSPIELTAGPADAGVRLDVLVARIEEVGSRAAAQRLIDEGKVTVDGVAQPKRHVVRSGSTISVTPEPPPPAPDTAGGAGVTYGVAYEDEYLMVIDKPAGLVVHPAPGHETGTLSQALAVAGAAGGEPWRPGIVHRLDRDTSGLLVVAKSDKVHRALQTAIREREVARVYTALVDGRPPSRSGTVDAPIGRDRRRRTAMSTSTDSPRSARTHFQTVEDLPASTLLEVRLETGRTHQIRAHLSEIGHPVLGDREYAGRAAAARLGLQRQFLHSARLDFAHPVTGEALTNRSELPADLAEALELARSEAPRA